MEIRKARVKECPAVQQFVNRFADRGEVLPRSRADVYENVRDFFVLTDEAGSLVGTAALHVVWEDFAEIRSLLVDEKERGKGSGKALAEACINEARQLGIRQVFALTYNPGFFEKLGFKEVDKSALPHKIWADCIHCPHFPDCNEVPVVKDLEAP